MCIRTVHILVHTVNIIDILYLTKLVANDWLSIEGKYVFLLSVAGHISTGFRCLYMFFGNHVFCYFPPTF